MRWSYRDLILNYDLLFHCDLVYLKDGPLFLMKLPLKIRCFLIEAWFAGVWLWLEASPVLLYLQLGQCCFQTCHQRICSFSLVEV